MTIDRALELAKNALHEQRRAAVDPSPRAVAENDEALHAVSAHRAQLAAIRRLTGMNRLVIDKMEYVTSYDKLDFLGKLAAQVKEYQDAGYDVEVQYGGQGSSGPMTALIVARGIAS